MLKPGSKGQWVALCVVLIGVIFALASRSLGSGGLRLSTVEHVTRVKIIESNNITTRPGSVYDIITRFESLLNFPRPAYNYVFIDTGLGAAEPLYPMDQVGFQGSWWQLFPAFWSERNRHIDHFSSLETPEGCFVDSLYMLRHIDEFPELYAKERQEGYENIVIRLEYYTRLKPGAECGRHNAHAPDPSFNVNEFFKQILPARTLADIPSHRIGLFEARVSAIKHLNREFGLRKWPAFDRSRLKENSLWYYPKGDFEPSPIFQPNGVTRWPGINPKHFIIPVAQAIPDPSAYSLQKLLKSDFNLVLNFLQGQPETGFDPRQEPGGDTLNINHLDKNHIYTSGLYRRTIENALDDVSNPNHFGLVAVIVRPFEPLHEGSRKHGDAQVRLVYQLKDPKNPERFFEQLFLHLNFDLDDSKNTGLSPSAGQQRHVEDYVGFALQNKSPILRLQKLAPHLGKVREVSFSSALSGTWVFGMMRRQDDAQPLKPIRIVRQGIDVGFYSSLYDTDLFQQKMKSDLTPEGEREALKSLLKDLRVSHYRDPKRHDARRIRFDRLTCAQCHQFAGRDAVHISANDGLDSRVQSPIRTSEYVYREIEQQINEWANGSF